MPKSLIAVTGLRVVLGLAFLPPLSNDEMPDRSIKQHGRDEALYGSSQVKTGRYENARRQQKRAHDEWQDIGMDVADCYERYSGGLNHSEQCPVLCGHLLRLKSCAGTILTCRSDRTICRGGDVSLLPLRPAGPPQVSKPLSMATLRVRAPSPCARLESYRCRELTRRGGRLTTGVEASSWGSECSKSPSSSWGTASGRGAEEVDP
jgi:hypothetical protein